MLDSRARSTWQRLGAILFLQFLTVVYLGWRFEVTMPGFSWSAQALWPWTFLVCETMVIAHESWSLMMLFRLSNHSPRADEYERRLRGEPSLPTIDVFIPSFSEGEEILSATIRAALELDYPATRVRVWVLDDGHRPWLESLCRLHGVGYLARPINDHGKAGNLNYALPRTNGQFILVIDADFILTPRFLLRTLGFLVYGQGIALVQTPQHFHNPDPVQHNLLGSRAWTEEQCFFMTLVQSARDAHDNAFCVGSGWLIRRALLEDVGGFPQESICEDLEITYVMKARGLRTLFLNEPLAHGLAPESVTEYIKQRVRWCTGTLQHLFLGSGPLRARGLSLRDRLFYLEPIVFWLTYPFILLVLLAPIVFWFTGWSAMYDPGESAALILLPRFIASYVIIYWLSEGKVLAPISTVHKILPAFHLSAAVARFFFGPFGRPFSVTVKGQNRNEVVVQWSVLWVFLVLALVLITGMLVNLTGYHEIVPLSHLTTLDVAWSGYSLLLLFLCMLACVELPRSGTGKPHLEMLRAQPLRAFGALLKRILG